VRAADAKVGTWVMIPAKIVTQSGGDRAQRVKVEITLGSGVTGSHYVTPDVLVSHPNPPMPMEPSRTSLLLDQSGTIWCSDGEHWCDSNTDQQCQAKTWEQLFRENAPLREFKADGTIE